GAVDGSLAQHDDRSGDGEVSRKRGAKIAGEIGHRTDIGDAATVNPSEDLAGAERFVAALGERRFERRALELCEVDARHRGPGFRHGISHISKNLVAFRSYREIPAGPAARAALAPARASVL